VGRRRPPVRHLGAGVVGHRDPAGHRRPADRMSHSSEGAAPAEPARYELRVQGMLDAAGKPGARACSSAATRPARPPFAGPVTDQAALTSPVTVWINLGNAAPYSGGRVLLARRCSRRELDLLLTTAPRGTHGRPCHAAKCRRRSAAGRVFAGSHDPSAGQREGIGACGITRASHAGTPCDVRTRCRATCTRYRRS
jgi:hypothetical protein